MQARGSNRPRRLVSKTSGREARFPRLQIIQVGLTVRPLIPGLLSPNELSSSDDCALIFTRRWKFSTVDTGTRRNAARALPLCRRNGIKESNHLFGTTYSIVPFAIVQFFFPFSLTFRYRKRSYRSRPRLPRLINTVTTPTCWTSGHSTNKRIDFTVDRVYRCFVPIFIECVGE